MTLQVLNDKTRECSQLKGDVHKLMSVVSAEKSALSKLQHDNQQLRTQQQQQQQQVTSAPAAAATAGEDNAEDGADMQRQAVKKLSHIIRDKELEIESLNMKNETLLQVRTCHCVVENVTVRNGNDNSTNYGHILM